MTLPDDSAEAVPAQGTSWQRGRTTSPLLMALADENYGVGDLVAFTTPDIPAWVEALPVPHYWQQIDLSETEATIVPARVLVWGPLAEGGWEATDTLSVYGYTGKPAFSDVLDSTARALSEAGASDISTQMLNTPVGPAVVGVAAERSTAIVTVKDRRIWTQLTHYVAGSDQPHAGQLIVHSLYVAQERLPDLLDDISVLTNSVQNTFGALVTAASGGGG